MTKPFKTEPGSVNPALDLPIPIPGFGLPPNFSPSSLFCPPFSLGALCALPPFGALALHGGMFPLGPNPNYRSSPRFRFDNPQNMPIPYPFPEMTESASAVSSPIKTEANPAITSAECPLAGLDRLMYYSKWASACSISRAETQAQENN